MGEFVQLQTNVPETMVLAYDEGRLTETRFGDKIFYTLRDGRTLSLAPYVAAKIHELGISKDVPFSICKREVRNRGSRKSSIEFEVKRLGPPENSGAKQTDLERDLQRSIDYVNAKKEAQLQPGPQPAEQVSKQAEASASTPAPVKIHPVNLLENNETNSTGNSTISAPVAPALNPQTLPAKPVINPRHVVISTGAGKSTASNGPNGGSNGRSAHGNSVAPPCTAVGIPAAPMKIPYNVAFREILGWVTTGLKEAGEQWSDQARQDMVSTVIIQASRDGFLGVWERPAK